MPKLTTTINGRALLLTNVFNLLTAIYFIIIAIVALVQLRWYHQLTVLVRLRHVVTSSTSYLAFILLIVVALVLMGTFVTNMPQLHHRQANEFCIRRQRALHGDSTQAGRRLSRSHPGTLLERQQQQQQQHDTNRESHSGSRHEASSSRSAASTCYVSLVYLLAGLGLILILIIWLVNTGELVRESIVSQLDLAFAKYQFQNRNNGYSIAIDAMQHTNNCCGLLDYTDFPHQRHTGLSAGLYPGSCCNKNVVGANVRLCSSEDIWRAKQTNGCTNVLASYYELISLLVVPVALVCLFVNISILALMTIARDSVPPPHRSNEMRAHEPNSRSQRLSATSGEHNNLAPPTEIIAAATTTTTTTMTKNQ